MVPRVVVAAIVGAVVPVPGIVDDAGWSATVVACVVARVVDPCVVVARCVVATVVACSPFCVVF